GVEILLVLNGSFYEHDKLDERIQFAVSRIVETGLPLVYVNQVGGQDELVFDGASFALDPDRTLCAQLPAFREHVGTSLWQRAGEGWRGGDGELMPAAGGVGAIYQAMTLGLRDYVDKNRFPGVILGLSGGVDSALSAAVAADAFGSSRVWVVMMPSPFTSRESLEDAEACARLLGVRYDT